MVIKEHENTYTGLKFTLRAVKGKKVFVITKEHLEKIVESSIMHDLGVHYTYIEDEEIIFNDFFEAVEKYQEWLND